MSAIIPNRTFFRIGDVAKILDVKPYVIRFWESEFPFLAPEKASSGQRVYRKSQIESLILIKHLLHVERYSIEGAKKKLTELRKTAKLRAAMNELVGDATQADSVIGLQIPKSQVASFEQKLEQKISDLQMLIRDPQVVGMTVPGLKKFWSGVEKGCFTTSVFR